MSSTRANRQVERAIRSAIDRLIEKSAIDTVTVDSGEDHIGEQALFVTVRLKSAKSRPSGHASVSLLKAMQDALREIHDERFAYLAFSAPDDQMAEPDRRMSA